jgi:hypothetical protein
MMDDDVFKNHVAKYEKHSNTLETLEWKNPETTDMAIWYVRQHGTLMVWGDCYDAIYQWYPNTSLKAISRYGESYFISKCQASPHGRDPSVFDRETLEKNMKEHFADSCTYKQPMCPEGECECCDTRRKEEKLFEEYGGWQAMSDEFEWVTWLRENGDEVFGCDWWESIPSDKALGPCIHLHLKGIKAAMAQLEKLAEKT